MNDGKYGALSITTSGNERAEIFKKMECRFFVFLVFLLQSIVSFFDARHRLDFFFLFFFAFFGSFP